jgi:hypothetical protein
LDAVATLTNRSITLMLVSSRHWTLEVQLIYGKVDTSGLGDPKLSIEVKVKTVKSIKSCILKNRSGTGVALIGCVYGLFKVPYDQSSAKLLVGALSVER